MSGSIYLRNIGLINKGGGACLWARFEDIGSVPLWVNPIPMKNEAENRAAHSRNTGGVSDDLFEPLDHVARKQRG